MSTKEYKIEFYAGESRHGNYGVNYLMSWPDNDFYAECRVPDDTEEFSEDYGYFALKADIIEQAKDAGISADSLKFQYDGQEKFLAEDASADVEVDRW